MEIVLTTPSTPNTETPDGLAALHHVGITVTDLERSVQWYSEMLGMVQWMEEKFPGGRSAGMMRPGTQVYLGLITHDQGEGESFAPHRTGLDHLSFSAATRDELRAWHAHLSDRGVPCSDVREYREPIPFALFTFTDPDGVALEVMHIDG
ncbi:VOC family protein [Haloechinothrix sp. YIM 98757]|uniref:VOC family protein n=1 Tax=Haloechinothrix aidingensis TaxID=2752311 RepID=A0A838A9F9_9PSEU|nr:VOC family protein [Haloechinothrix aidingensis]MBA0125321.1 VOC family protein [Haloechinothrix aidingensis]